MKSKGSADKIYFREGRDYVERVNRYYDFVTGLYKEFYGEHFHICFQQEGESREAAMARMNDDLLRYAGIQAGDRVLDLGGGIGSLSILVAQATGCPVTCVNINKHQISEAKRRAREAKVDIDFVNQDIMSLELDQQYDVAFMIDVDCHLPDKDVAIRRILRVLRPGGRLVMTAWLQKESPSLLEQQVFLRTLYRCNSFAHLATFSEYDRIFARHKLNVLHRQDGTKEIKHYVEKLYDQPIGLVRDGISWPRLFMAVKNPRLIASVVETAFSGVLTESAARTAVEELFLGVLYIKVCYDAGLFQFGVFVVEKPV